MTLRRALTSQGAHASATSGSASSTRLPPAPRSRTPAGHLADRSDDAALGAGGADLDQLLSEREQLNSQLQHIIDDQTEPWGIKVSTVEIKDVEIPEAMQRAMARQAEAERERRAKIINAEGEFPASEKLAQAAEVIGRAPAAIQLRFL